MFVFIFIIFNITVFSQNFSQSDLIGTWLYVKYDPFSLKPPDVANFTFSDSLDFSKAQIIFKEDGHYIYKYAGNVEENKFSLDGNKLTLYYSSSVSRSYNVMRLDNEYLVTLYNEKMFDEYTYYKRIK